MKLNWTNDDRAAFGEFLVSSLGRKFIGYLEQDRPELAETTDLTAMAMNGVKAQSYDNFLKKIEGMARLPTAPLPKVQFVEVEKD